MLLYNPSKVIAQKILIGQYLLLAICCLCDTSRLFILRHWLVTEVSTQFKVPLPIMKSVRQWKIVWIFDQIKWYQLNKVHLTDFSISYKFNG